MNKKTKKESKEIKYWRKKKEFMKEKTKKNIREWNNETNKKKGKKERNIIITKRRVNDNERKISKCSMNEKMKENISSKIIF